MAERLLKFTGLERIPPEKRGAVLRRRDFQEIYERFAADAAAAQASRCSQCGVPFCQSKCPLHNNIPDWLKLAAEDRLEDAYLAAAATNPMPEICGRICPQDRLCESACVIEQSGHGTVTIGAVEQHLAETAFDRGWVAPIARGAPCGRSVGIVGAGPAGLAAAERLLAAGFDVAVYDRHDRAGGLLIYGIPNFKLEKSVVRRRVGRLEAGGARFILNFELGRDAGVHELRARHDAVLLATGAYKARALDCPVAADARPVPALDYLIASNRRGLGDAVPAFDSGALDARGKRVVVVGGGDTAMDCVRTAVRQGASSVVCLYRRDRANMPGSAREVANAKEEGVIFEWLAAPKAVAHGRIKAVRMRPADPGAKGGRPPEEAPGTEFDIAADLVIEALGFDAEDLSGAAAALAVTRRGTLRVDPASLETTIEGVFAAGDVVRGPSLVVWAIRDGLAAAEAIGKRLAAAPAGRRLLAAAE